jgi:hypothetical protein
LPSLEVRAAKPTAAIDGRPLSRDDFRVIAMLAD